MSILFNNLKKNQNNFFKNHFLFLQIVSDHYNGNRHRNAVVRQDFPTALHEQIKEKEDAERQAQLYHEMINEQEKVDAEVARDLADKLKRETDRERKKLNQQNELLARKLQEQSFDRQRQPPVGNDYPAPPRNHPKPNHLKNSPKNDYFSSPPKQFNQKTNQLNYVSLDLDPPKSTQLPSKPTPTSYTEIMPSTGFHPIDSNNLKFTTTTTPEKKNPHVNLHSHTPEKNYSNSRKYDFPQVKTDQHHFDGDGVSGLFINTNQELSDFGTSSQDVAESIRQYHMPSEDIPINHFRTDKHKNFPYDDDFRNNSNFQKLSPEKYDYIIGNDSVNNSLVRQPPKNTDSKVNEVGLPTGTLFKNRENNFSDPERIKTLQELGLPPEEIQEIDRRLRQEIRDEVCWFCVFSEIG